MDTSQKMSQVIHRRAKQDNERKKRLEQMKAQAKAFKRAQQEKAIQAAATKESTYRPGQMGKINAAGAELDERLSSRPKDAQASQRLSESTTAILSKWQAGAVKLSEATCIKPFCRVTMALYRPQLIGPFFKAIETESWPWKGRHMMLITQTKEPMKPGEKLLPGQPVEVQLSLYFSNTDESLPVDKDLQHAGTGPGD